MKIEEIRLIQGGMGINVSGFKLAREVSLNRGLGTVSGVLAERVLAGCLQRGDVGEHFRRALAHFPFPSIAKEVLDAYFVKGGIPVGQRFKAVPMFTFNPTRLLISLVICANFSLVWLAKEGHSNPVSINYLEKIQLPHLYALFGAMLAEVDAVTMGAGIPLQVPGILDSFAEGKPATYRITVLDTINSTIALNFDPREYFGRYLLELKRPAFLPIVSTDVLASIFLKKTSGSIQGFVVERPTAGGHNAPPRGKLTLDVLGEPIYGVRDEVDFSKIVNLGLPFWLGGSQASPKALANALSLGATGIQVGSIFALCEESNLDTGIKLRVKRLGYDGKLSLKTSLRVSPSGFPFKMVDLEGTLSDNFVYCSRKRNCDQSCLRVAYLGADGKIGFRCPAEKVEAYIRKGGKLEDTDKRRCLGNGLLSAVSLGNPGEIPIVTLGDDVSFLSQVMKSRDDFYTAKDVCRYLLGVE